MPAKLQEIEGRFHGENFRFGDTLVGSIALINGSQEKAAKVGHCGQMIAIKGMAEPDELEWRQSYRFFGRFSDYRNKRTGVTEKQFHFQTFVPARSHDREGVIAYLEKAGRGLGMGRGTAAKLWEAHGANAVRVVREDPGQIRKVNSKVTEDQADQIAQRLQADAATEDATIEITNLLTGRGFPKMTARLAIKEWGNQAADQIKRDPYALMRFRGCGFKLCDQLWLELGLPRERLRRQALCAWYSIASNSDGHTWFPVGVVAHAVTGTLGQLADPKRAIKLATRLGKFSPDHYGALAAIRSDGASGPIVDAGGTLWLAEGRKAQAEKRLAELVSAALDEGRPKWVTSFEPIELTDTEIRQYVQCQRCGRKLTAPEVHVWDGKPFGPTCIGYISDGTDVDVFPLEGWLDQLPPIVHKWIEWAPKCGQTLPAFSLWPDPNQIADISDHQRDQLAKALCSRIALLCGSPGTGKTYTIAQLVKAMLRLGLVGIEDIAIGAPTGKAAVRITENLQAAGLPLKARTWHSLLGVGEADESGNWGFRHNEANPWPFRVIIGDESSMLDTSLMCSVMKARPRGCHVLLVGDVNQLPPVGHGAPFRDLIAADVPRGELREIKRNSGGIVEACAAIRDEKPWEPGDNLSIWEHPSKGPLEGISFLLERCAANRFDPVWDCQVLVAVNARSELSRKKVNEVLQERLNNQPKVKGTPFRLDDKVVCLQNGRFTALESDAEAQDENDGNEVFVANGEIGRVVEMEDKAMLVKLDNPSRLIRVPRGKAESGDGEEKSSTGCSWDLAYALSVHKSQGSEFPVVIVALDEYPGARRICDRSWLYTSISRAKDKCFLVGKKATADAMCRRVAIWKRKTFLKERIRLASVENVLEGI